MIKKAVILILSLVLLLWGMEKGYDFFMKRNVNLKSSFVSNHRIDAKVLFLGPCQTLWMMEPDTFQKYTGLKAYNLATVHANFAESKVMLWLYLRVNKAPQYLFLYVSGESVDGSFTVFNTYNFPQFMDEPWIRDVIKEQDPAFYRYSFIPFMKYAYYNEFVNFNLVQGVKHTLAGKEIPYFANGYVHPHDVVWDGRLERFKAENPQGRTFKWKPEEIKNLKDLVNMAKKNNIRLVLYESPMLNEVKPFLANRDEIKNKISSFAEENFVDYWVFDTMKISNSRTCFFSILNTNDKGSAIFNKVFAEYFNQWNQIKMYPKLSK